MSSTLFNYPVTITDSNGKKYIDNGEKAGVCFETNSGGQNYGKQYLRLFRPNNDDTLCGYYFTANGDKIRNFDSFVDVISPSNTESILQTLGFNPLEYKEVSIQDFEKKLVKEPLSQIKVYAHTPTITFENEKGTYYDIVSAEEHYKTIGKDTKIIVNYYNDNDKISFDFLNNGSTSLVEEIKNSNPTLSKYLQEHYTIAKTENKLFDSIKTDENEANLEAKNNLLDIHYQQLYKLDDRKIEINKSFEDELKLSKVIEEVTQYNFPVDKPYTTAQDNALDAMDTISNQDSISITLDRTSDDIKKAEICGMTITDSNGKVLLDENFCTTAKINDKYAKDHNLNLTAIRQAAPLKASIPKIQNLIQNSDQILFHNAEDANLLNQELTRINKDWKADKEKILQANIAKKGVSCKKALATIAEVIANYRQPIFIRFIRSIQAGYQNKKTAQKEINSLKKVIKAHKKHQEELVQEYQKTKGQRDFDKQKDKPWKPIEKGSMKWNQLSRVEKMIEKQLIELFPQNIPITSTWRMPLRTTVPIKKATKEEVLQKKQELLKKLEKSKKFKTSKTKTTTRKI